MTQTIEQQLSSYITMMERAIRDGSLGGGSGREDSQQVAFARQKQRSNAEELNFRKAQEKQLKENTRLLGGFNKSLNKFANDLDLKSRLISSSFEEAVQALDYDNLQLVPKALENQLKKSPLFRSTNISNLEEAFEFLEGMTDKRALVNSNAAQDYLSNGVNASAESLEILKKVSDRTGKSMRETALSRARLKKEVEEHTKIQQTLNHQMRGGAIGELIGKATALKKDFIKLKTSVQALGKALEESLGPAFQYGTNVTDSLTAFTAGMNAKDFAKNVATYRQSIQASGLSIDQFRDITEEGTLGLTAYTGSLQNSVKLQASVFEAASRMGVTGAANQRAFMDQQVETFKKFNSVFSMTSEEFMGMNKQIKESSEINAHMYRLNQKQRAQAHLDIQQTVLRLRTMGLEQAAAMKVVEAMSAIGAKSPKERMKQAARLQAVGGAMGFGGEASQAAQIMRRGFNQEGDRERFAELQQTMQKTTGAFMGQGLPQEMMAAQMLQSTQLEDILGPKSAFSDLNKQQFQATESIEKLNQKRNQVLGSLLGVTQMISNFMAGPLLKGILGITGLIGGLITVLTGGSFLKGMVGAALSGAASPGAGIIQTVLSRAVGMLGPLGLIASVVALVGGAVAAEHAATPPEETSLWDRFTQSDEEKKQKESMKKLVEMHAKKAQEAIDATDAQVAAYTSEIMAKRSHMPSFGSDADDRLINMGGGKSMSAGEYSMQSKIGEASRGDLGYRIEEYTKRAAEAKNEERLARDKGKKEQADQLKEENEKLIAAVEELKVHLDQLNKPTEEIVKVIKEGNEEDKERHKETINLSKRNVKIQWARVQASGN